MPKRKEPAEKPEEQFKRFVEAAEHLEVDKAKAERSFKRLSDREPKAKADPSPSE